MLTIVLIFMGILVVCGAIYLAMSSGTRGGRHDQSGRAEVREQGQEAERATSTRATGGGDD